MSTSSRLSTDEISNIVDQLKQQQHCDTTKKCYYTIWKIFNNFFIRFDRKPGNWEDRLTLFVTYLIDNERQSSTVKSYISAIKAVFKMNNSRINHGQYLLTSLTRACRLKNDQIRARLPVQKGMLKIILEKTDQHLMNVNQPYLLLLYQTLFSTAYFGLFRVGELTVSEHQIKARDIHIALNEKKILFVLHTSKTHHRNLPLQMIKIKSEKILNNKEFTSLGKKQQLDNCPYFLLKLYSQERGGYSSEVEPFNVFRDKRPVTSQQFQTCLKTILKFAGFDPTYYGTHSLRSGRGCDLFNLGVPIETIKKLGRWKSNTIYRYLKN